MKKSASIILTLTLLVMLVFMLSGCGLFANQKKWSGTIFEVTENSKECVEDFAYELADDDIEGATSYLHPNSEPSADELESYIKNLEQTLDFDFSEETAFEFEGFDPEVNLEHVKYDISAKASQGGKTVTIKLGVLNDEYGFGIYKISVE